MGNAIPYGAGRRWRRRLKRGMPVVAAAMVALSSVRTHAAQRPPIKIAVIVDVTGPASSLGIPQRDTAAMLLEEVAAKGGIRGHPIQLLIHDGESSEAKILLAVRRAIEEERAALVICCSQGAVGLAALEITQRAEVPILVLARGVVEPAKENPWAFRIPPGGNLIAEFLADYLVRQRISQVAWISVDSGYGEGGRVEFERLARGRGISVVASERFAEGQPEAQARLGRIVAARPQAVVAWAAGAAAAMVARDARRTGLQSPLFFGDGSASREFLALAGEAADGVRFPAGKLLGAEELPAADPRRPILLAYSRSFEAAYGPRSLSGGYAWDAINLGLQAAERALGRAGPEDLKGYRRAIRDELERVAEFFGITGAFNTSPADHNGLDKRALAMFEIVGGRWRLAK